MTKLVFTVCSNSHLAKAKSMADSFISFNPDFQIVIGITDVLTPEVNIDLFFPHKLLEIKDIGIEDLDWLADRYSPLELSCLGKPYFAAYFLDTIPELTHLYYFDSDMCFYNNIDSIENTLTDHDIVLTPHLSTDLPNGGIPIMRDYLNSGLYNGGFFAIKRSNESSAFIDWWKKRVHDEGFNDVTYGMFSDQLWLNFVPLLFKNVLIDLHFGHNAAYWNLHERQIEELNNQYVVNKKYPLVYFHFSGFNPSQPEVISVHQNRYDIKDFPVLKTIFGDYAKSVTHNNHAQYSKLPNAYFKKSFIDQKTKSLRQKLLILSRKLTRMLDY